MGLISSCKDFIFCWICVVTDLDFGTMTPRDDAIMPAWSLSESAVCPGVLWAEAVVGEPSTGESGPLRSSPYIIPGHTLFEHHRDGAHPSLCCHGEHSAQLVLGRDVFWLPSQQRRPITPPQCHLQGTSPSTMDQTCRCPCRLPQLQGRQQLWLAGWIILTYTPPPPMLSSPHQPSLLVY